MNEDKRRLLFDPYRRPEIQRTGRPAWVSLILSLVGVFGLSFCLTCLYLGMRGVMGLGGFVAAGGPYAIAHPAPRYVWILPVSIWVGLICLFLYAAMVKAWGGLSLAPLAWPALFISLGWNFLDFTFRPPGGGGLAWGWLICGVIFWLMGFVPLVLIVQYVRQKRRGDKLNAELQRELAAEGSGAGRRGRAVFLLVQLACVGLGIYLAALFFASQTKAG